MIRWALEYDPIRENWTRNLTVLKVLQIQNADFLNLYNYSEIIGISCSKI